MSNPSVTRLYHVVSPEQLAALASAGFRRIEPGRGGEHLVLLKHTQRYAEMIARAHYVPRYGAGIVLGLSLAEAALAAYPASSVAYEEHLEHAVPVAALPGLSLALAGPLRVISVFLPRRSYSVAPDGRMPPGVDLPREPCRWRPAALSSA